ncbi:RNA-binding cell elongation regulator Jag/EloR [Streptococcus dentiloxodontae]
MVVYTGATVEEAIEKGLADLGIVRMKAHIKVINREKKGFLGFGRKPAKVSIDSINEKTAHKADQEAVKGVPEAVNRQNTPVTSAREDALALNKVSRLAKSSENKLLKTQVLEKAVITDELLENLEQEAAEVALKESQSVSVDSAVSSEASSFETFVASEFDDVETANNKDVEAAAADVKSYIENVIYEMDLEASLEVRHNRRTIIIQIETPEAGRIIGYHGKVLKSLQLLAQNYLHDRHSKHFTVSLNVHDYLEQRAETLIDFAGKAANRVLETGKVYRMDPMSNSERKIVHKAIAQIDGVTSHSEGDDPNRYVVVTLEGTF